MRRWWCVVLLRLFLFGGAEVVFEAGSRASVEEANGDVVLLRKEFAGILSIPESQISDDLAYQSVPQWGSLEHVRLIIRLDELFGTGETAKELREFTTFRVIKERVAGCTGPGSSGDGVPAPARLCSEIDRGLGNSILDLTRITDIDPEGRYLRYRGHAVSDLADRESFDSVAGLLIEKSLGQERREDVVRALCRGADAADGRGAGVAGLGSFEKFLSHFADIDLRSPAPSVRPEQVVADQGWACLAAAVTLVAGKRYDPSRSFIAALVENMPLTVSPEQAVRFLGMRRF